MDLRGEKVLTPEDGDRFDMVIFGGILGDHPPRDRTSGLRKSEIEMRHLGSLQLSTDTAILVSKLILENKMRFESIPFVDEPEIKGKVNEDGVEETIQMEGFRYVSKEYDLEKGEIVRDEKLCGHPLIDETIKNELMFEEFDLDQLTLE